jgi:hypothetical protein
MATQEQRYNKTTVPELQFPNGIPNLQEEDEPNKISPFRRPAEVLGGALEGLSKPFVWVNEKIEKPWAAVISLAAQGLIPGEQSIEKALKEKGPNDKWFDTITKAYTEDETLPGWGKFLLETSMPLWYMIPSGAISKVLSTTLGPSAKALTGKLLQIPLIKKMASESATSLAFNAPRRGNQMMTLLRGAYESKFTARDLGNRTITQKFLSDLIEGTMDEPIKQEMINLLTRSTSVGRGPKILRIFDDMLGGDEAVSGMVKTSLRILQPLADNGTLTWKQMFDSVSGALRGAYAEKAGLHAMSYMHDTLSDVYQFWRAGVLLTPTYVMQNMVEDFTRVAISTFEPVRWGPRGVFDAPFPIGKWKFNRFSASYDAAKKGLIHPEIANYLLPRQLRAMGFKNVDEVRAGLPDLIRQHQQWADDMAVFYPQEAARELKKSIRLQEMYDELPKMNMNIVDIEGRSILSMEASTEGLNPYAAKHPMNAAIDSLLTRADNLGKTRETFEASRILAEKGEEAKQAFLSLKAAKRLAKGEKVTGAIMFPRNIASELDSAAVAQIQMDQSMKFLKSQPGVEDLSKVLDDSLFSKEQLIAFKKVGIADEHVAALRKLVTYADNPEQAMDYIFNTVGTPFPIIDELEHMSHIPRVVGEKYAGELRKAAFLNQRGQIAKLKKQMITEVDSYYRNPDNYLSDFHRETMSSLRQSYPEIDDMMKPIDDFAQGIKDTTAQSYSDLEDIYGAAFVKKLKDQDGLFQADYLAVESEARMLEFQILTKFTKQGQLRLRSKDVNKLRAEFKGFWNTATNQAREDQMNLLTKVRAFSQFRKVTRDPAILQQAWTGAYNNLLSNSKFMSFGILAGLSPDTPNLARLWNNYNLVRSTMYHDTIKQVAAKFALPRQVGVPMKQRLLEANKVVGDVFDTVLGEMPRVDFRGFSTLERRMWTYMTTHSDDPQDIIDIAVRWGANEQDAIKAANKLVASNAINFTPGNITTGAKSQAVLLKKAPNITRRGGARKRDAVIQDFMEKVQTAYQDPKIAEGKLAAWRNNSAAQLYGLNRAYAVMGDYSTTTNLDEMMSKVFPFWFFPSRSIPFYAKTFMQKPYLAADLERYLEATKDSKTTPESLIGYLPIPVGDQYFYINPMRPMMGYQILGHEPMAGLGQPMFQQVQQMFSMLGFGFNPALTWSAEAINKVTSSQGLHLTRGEIQPLFPQQRWLQDATALALGTWLPMPEQSFFSQTVDGMPDWKKRNIEKELAVYINDNPELRDLWPTPRQLWNDARNGNEQAQQIVSQQVKKLSFYGLVSAALPIYNRRNKEEIVMYNDRDQMLTDIFKSNGLTEDQVQARFETARRQGFSPMMYLNRAQRREVYESKPEWEPWQGLTRVGIRPEEREMERQTEEFFQTFDEAKRQIQQQLDVVDQAFLEGRISGYDWRNQYNQIQAFHAGAFQMLVGDGKAPDETGNPGRLPLARVTAERVDYFRKKFGNVTPPVHPEDEALNFYNAISPEIDASTGLPDYDTYFVKREEFMKSMPYQIRKYIQDDQLRARYNSPVEAMYRKDLQVIQPYLASRREVAKIYPEFTKLQNMLAREQDPRVRQQIQQRMAKYEQMVSDRREKLRLGDANLEALLLKWGYVSTILNPKTNEILDKVYK